MKYKDPTGIVPAQYTGEEIIADSDAELKDGSEALTFYYVVKERLLNVNNWHKLAGFLSAQFQVVDKDGREVKRNVQKGDYVRVDIPGPGSKEGEGFDWVHVEDLKEVTGDAVQSIGFRVRPTANPLNKSDHIAHFYDDIATSSFIVTKEESKVIATIIDRNLKPNDDTESLSDKLRHTVVGRTAINSFSKIQWKNLAKGLVEMK
jgi:hypothetical protein